VTTMCNTIISKNTTNLVSFPSSSLQQTVSWGK